MMDLADTEDFWEGPKAFLEKRDAGVEGPLAAALEPTASSGVR